MIFSIVTTVLNNEKFVLQCLNSFKNQNINKKLVEHIVIDGGSTDKTISIIKNFKKKNKSIKFFSKKSSIYEGINYGIKKSKGKIIGILHSDDMYSNNNVLSFVKNQFDKNNQVDAIYSNIKIVKKNNKNKILRYFKSKQLNYEDYLKCDHPPHTSLFLRRKVFEKHGYYNKKFKIASDFEFMLRVLGINRLQSKYLDKTFIIMRSGGTSTESFKNILLSNYEVYQSFKKNNLKINIIYIFIKIFKKIFQLKLLN